MTAVLGSLGLSLYAAASWAVSPLVQQHLRRRAAAGKEDPQRLPERLGHAGLPRPAGPVVWMHAASVGESLSLLPLIAALQERWPHVVPLVTTGTPTSAALMASRLAPPALHQFAPVDVPSAVARFLDHWRPNLALWIESELWPNTLVSLRRRQVPAVLVNARMSERSWARWHKARPLAAAVLQGFGSVLAQSEKDAARLRALGAAHVITLGNLKGAAPALPDAELDRQRLTTLWAGRQRWLAASTHEGEEMIAARVHAQLARTQAGLLTIVVPRHPQRGPAVAAQLRAAGLRVALRSAGEEEGDVYVADTLGELGLFYRLSPVTFLGGSLVEHGGHNPLEPARLRCATLIGPHRHNFIALSDELITAGGLQPVADEAGLAAAVDTLLNDPAAAAQIGRKAQDFALRQADVLPRTVAALSPWLALL